MATLLSDEQIDAQLGGLQNWRREGSSIVRDLEVENFVAAVNFVERVAEVAERANHHPDILIHGYKRVRLSLSTHSAGGLTEADFAMAREIEQLAGG
jgi:4a-hydroxytetrahydrobiopterin dehydratase